LRRLKPPPPNPCYGDIVLSPKWRLISAIEGANGVILFAWSTAFLLTLNRLNVLEMS